MTAGDDEKLRNATKNKHCAPLNCRALACLTPRRREKGGLRMLRLGSYRLHQVETSAGCSAGYYLFFFLFSFIFFFFNI